MMKQENQDREEAHLHSQEEMESLVLDEPSKDQSLPDNRHPLQPVTVSQEETESLVHDEPSNDQSLPDNRHPLQPVTESPEGTESLVHDEPLNDQSLPDIRHPLQPVTESPEEMESLVLDEPSNDQSLPDNRHPLQPVTVSQEEVESLVLGGPSNDQYLPDNRHPLQPVTVSQEESECLVHDEPSNEQYLPHNRHPLLPVTVPDDPLFSSALSFASDQTPKFTFNSLLDPPSYAEAVFTSFDSPSNDHENPEVSSRSNPSSSDYLYIAVSDPQKEQELTNSLVPGGNTYYTYLITTRTNLTEYGGPGSEFSVRRRFRDFVTLSDRLSESYRGYFIPIRPDKNTVESQVMQKQDFVEQRMLALEKYLRKLAAHPVIRKSEELTVFLRGKGKLPLVKSADVATRMLDGAVQLPGQSGAEAVEAVDLNEVAQPAKGGRDLFRIFKELKQSVANDWVGTKPLVVEEDKEFLERKEKLMELEQQLNNVSLQAESLVKSQQDIGETMGELGLAFVKLTKFETEEAIFDSQRTRAADMRNAATAAVKSGRLYRELNAQTIKHLDKLHEYLGTMLVINNAFSERSSALLTVQTLASELSSLKSQIEKLEIASSKIFGGDKSRARKIEELKEAIRVSENAKFCADKEYEQIKENNRSELERIDEERRNDFISMLRGFIVNQAGYAEKMAAVWDKLAEETRKYSRDGS